MLKFVRNTWKYWSYETDDEILILLVLVQCLWTLKVVFWAEFLWEIGFGFISGNYLYLSVLRKSKKKPEKYLKLSWYKIFSKNLNLLDFLSDFVLLRLSITCGLWNLKLDRHMRVSLPSIKLCSAAPSSFRLLASARWSNRCAQFRQRNSARQ